MRSTGRHATSVPRLEGMIDRIYHVRERQIDIAIEKESNKEKQHKLHAERTKSKNEWPSAIRVVYYELIFFKNSSIRHGLSLFAKGLPIRST